MSTKEEDKVSSGSTQKQNPTKIDEKSETRNKNHDESVQQRLRRQEEELRMLRGKIKGYETLGSLYQEKRLEVNTLKGKLQELQSPPSPPMSLTLKQDRESFHLDLNQQEPLSYSAMPRGGPYGPSLTELPAHDSKMASLSHKDDITQELALVSLADEGDTERLLKQHSPTPPTSNDLSATSSSYKIINSEDNSTGLSSSMVSGKPGEDWNITSKAPVKKTNPAAHTHGSKLQDLVLDVREESHLLEESQRDSNNELSINTREELSRLVLAGDLDGSMIKYMVKSAKLEKQIKTSQALLNTVIAENQDLKSENEKLHAETCAVRQEAIQMEREMRLSNSKSPDRLQQEEKLPEDWVRVDTDKKQRDGAGLSSAVETDLRRKVDKLKQHAKELLRANTAWDNHCKRLNEDHDLAVEDLRKKLQLSKKEIENLKTADDREQRQTDTLLAEKEEAVRRSTEERQRRREAEQQWDIQRQRAEQLDIELKEQSEIINALTEVRNSLMSMRQSSRSDGNTEIEVLKQQVTIYKDDFDNERRDRERAQAEKEALDEQLRTANLTHETQRDQLRQKELELGRITEEKMEYHNRLSEAKVELRRIQTLLGSSRSPTAPPYTPCLEQPARIAYPPHQPPPPYVTTEPRIQGGSSRSWPCRTCTYDNPAVRITCEMCGAARHRGQNVPTTVENMDQQCVHILSSHGYDQCDAAGVTTLGQRQRLPTQYGLGTEGLGTDGVGTDGVGTDGVGTGRSGTGGMDTDVTEEKMETSLL